MANVTQNQESQFAIVKKMLAQDSVVQNYRDVLGAKAPQFIASVINTMGASDSLKACSAASILGASMVAASLDLPIDPNLGFAAIVPYMLKNGESRAQLQIQYKGYIQLAVRSAQYEKMNVSSVYADELNGYNPITGECDFVDDFSACTMRADGKQEDVVGYYAWFRLLSGFTKSLYMTKQEISNHALRYSSAYRKDINRGRTSSLWSTDFDAMAQKTVLKRLLSKYGVLSVQMQRAVVDDQRVFDVDGEATYADNGEDEEKASNPMADMIEVNDAEDE